MKTFFGLLCLLLISRNSLAQTRIKIVDQSLNSALPLATIVNLSKDVIRFADENGTFLFEWNHADSVKITHIGYYDAVIQLGKITNNTIQLIQKPVLLSNVTIRPCIKSIDLNYSNFNPPANYGKFGGMSWSGNIDGAKAAIMIRPLARNAQLSLLEFELKKAFGAPKRSKGFPRSPIRFSFYSIDQQSGLPSELLTNQTLIYIPKKIGKQIVNMDSLCLAIPDSGIYIGIEYLVESKHCYPLRFEPSKYADSVMMYYPLMFDGVRSEDFRLAFYDYRVNQWRFFNTLKDLDQPNATIKFGISYSYCDKNKN